MATREQAPDGKTDPREQVLNVAARLFAERDFDDVTMSEIATKAGVARASVFNYFGSKRALIEALTETVLTFWRDMLDDALADDRTPTPDLLRHLCEQMGLGIESQRRLFRGVFREIASIQLGMDVGDVAQRANKEARERLEELFDRGRARGDINNQLSAPTLAAAFHSLTNGTITNWLYQDSTRPLAECMQEAAEVFLSPIEGETR